MNFLLPHRFKRIGLFLAPTGLALWICMQKGLVTLACTYLFGPLPGSDPDLSYHPVNVAVAVTSFFSFLAGLYFLSFSKERVEDEMIQRTRLDSFGFAALFQILLLILGFTAMLLFGEPGKEGLMLFFLAAVCAFWLCFIARFHFILHVRLKD